MTIKFKCPHCQKALAIKDELAGKSGPCPACKKVLTVPAPVSQAADVEDLAAQALADEEKVEKPKETKFVEFNCPMCDDPVKVSAEMAGKQTPCPSCRRIVKVPLIKTADPKDWRKQNTRLPAGARQNMEAEPEGAWGSTTSTTRVSRQSLVEADVIPTEKERLTTRQWIIRGTAAVAGVAVVALGVVFTLNYMAWNQQNRLVTAALQAVGEGSKATPLMSAAAHRAAGEYHLRRKTRDDLEQARTMLQKARSLLAGAPEGPERNLLVQELALTQIGLGGDDQEVMLGLRVKWDDVLRELQQTLQLAPISEQPGGPKGPTYPGARLLALAETARGMAEQGNPGLALRLAQLALDPGDPLRPEGLARVGLVLLPTDRAQAEAAATQALTAYPPAGAQPQTAGAPAALPMAPSLVVLCSALEMQAPQLQPLLAKPVPSDPPVVIGLAAALARQGKVDAGRAVIQPLEPAARLQALVAMIEQKPEEGSLLDSAVETIQRDLKGKALPAALLRQIASNMARSGQAERVKSLADAVSDPTLRCLLKLQAVRATVTASAAPVGPSAADGLEPAGLCQALALETVARHDARLNSGVVKSVTGWDESARPLASLGVALGLQDAAR